MILYVLLTFLLKSVLLTFLLKSVLLTFLLKCILLIIIVLLLFLFEGSIILCCLLSLVHFCWGIFWSSSMSVVCKNSLDEYQLVWCSLCFHESTCCPFDMSWQEYLIKVVVVIICFCDLWVVVIINLIECTFSVQIVIVY